MNRIETYFKYRQNLIEQYLKGDMTKREYLDRNYEEVINCGFGPFRKVDSVEKGLFNYQYYNALAKHYKRISLHREMEPALRQENREKSNYFYGKKDKATFSALSLLEYKGVTAYFVQVRSKNLKGRLFEIVLDEHTMILHSVNEHLLEKLREEEVFLEEKRKSLIDEYINERY